MNDGAKPDTRSLRERVADFLRWRESDQEMREGIAQRVQELIEAGSLGSRLAAWARLIEWARSEPLGLDPNESGMLSLRALRRWTLTLDFLDANSDVRAQFQASVTEIFSETEGVNLFGSVGLPSGRGFIAEFGDRMVQRLLPAPPDEHDLAKLLTRLYRTKAHVERFARLPHDIFSRLADLLRPPARPDIWSSLRRDFADGFRLLAARVQNEGLAPKLRARGPAVRVDESPFFLQQRAADALLLAWSAGAGVETAAQTWRREAIACRKAMEQIVRRLETHGVSVDIVYGLDAIDRCLTRMDLMATMTESAPGKARDMALHTLLCLLMAATQQDRSLSHLARANLKLLQRKIVDRAGKTGEHYIAWTRKEYGQICAAAAGGGLLTTFTAAVKLTIVGAGFALFFEGFCSGLNYAVSFLLMQAFGLVLATKQPAMTAAALANIMRTERGPERLDDIVDFAVQICRSQLAAAIANVSVVWIGAYAFCHVWEWTSGRPFLNPHEAEHVFETLSPVDSGTVWYAALTGVVLWVASLVGGWFDNWAVYHRLPQAIAEHPVGQRFGRKRMAKLAGLVSRNISGWATNISLGFMLGLTPVVGTFLGLPLDVRHVTLSTGALALASTSLHESWLHGGWFLWAVAGIGTMFVLNLSVSFLLALYTASRAYDLPSSFMLDFARGVLHRFVRSPGDFVLPPSRSAAARQH